MNFKDFEVISALEVKMLYFIFAILKSTDLVFHSFTLYDVFTV